jgi:hypothetical protein
MAAAQQNYTIELGQSLASVLTIALNGVAIPATAATALNSNQVVVNDPGNLLMPLMAIGNSVSGPGIQPNTLVTNIAGTTLTLNQNATAANAAASIVVGAQVALNLTGVTFLFSAKTNKTLLDTDPTAIEFNWTETGTPLLGQTTLVLTNTRTAAAEVNTPYFYQIWMNGAPGLAPISPLLEGTITFTQSVSQRVS